MTAAAAVLLFLLCLPGEGQAQTCSATITNIDFGDPNLLSGSTDDALGTVTITCTRIPPLTVVKMCPSIGEGSGGAVGSSRLLRSASGSLAYQLYQDTARTQAWGSLDEPELGSVPAILLGSGFATSATATKTVYGRIFGSQRDAPTGAYLSTFSGNQTAFTYAGFPFGVGTTSSCSGFVGTAVIHPAFTVTAQAGANCTITTTDLDFGNAGILSSAVSAQGSLSVACTRSTPFSVGLDGGLAAAPPASRRMTSTSGDAVTYGLYRDAGGTQPWGMDTGTRAGGTGTGASQALPIYGRVPAQATPRPGIYSDRIVATVTY